MCPQAASSRYHASPAWTPCPLSIEDPSGARNGYSVLDALSLGCMHMCVFPHLLCTLSRRKTSSKFIWHCCLHLGGFQARRKLQQHGHWGCPLGERVWPVQSRVPRVLADLEAHLLSWMWGGKRTGRGSGARKSAPGQMALRLGRCQSNALCCLDFTCESPGPGPTSGACSMGSWCKRVRLSGQARWQVAHALPV